jgi:hypothetical protein
MQKAKQQKQDDIILISSHFADRLGLNIGLVSLWNVQRNLDFYGNFH